MEGAKNPEHVDSVLSRRPGKPLSRRAKAALSVHHTKAKALRRAKDKVAKASRKANR